MSAEMVELPVDPVQPTGILQQNPVRPTGILQQNPVRPTGILQQNRVFLDFFWDLAKPEQETRLLAVEHLIQYLRSSNKADELDYTMKRLVDGLAHTREAARPGFSLALGQLLGAFEDIPLESTLHQIQEKYNLQRAKKKLLRNAMFGNLFGVLALHQSSRLSKEPQVVLGCVQLLQSLTQHREHLKDLPTKTMMDILTEIPEEVFEEVLLGALQTDLASAFSTPEQLQLLLVALQHFPHTLKPKKLKKLLGSSTIINATNIPKLTELLKLAAQSVKKECVLPSVALDLLKLSLKEDSFQLLWTEAIVNGMLKDQSGPTHYLCYRLLGSALPLLSVTQLKEVLSGEVMRLYGEHVVSAQKLDRFKLAPEMDAYVSDFLQGCDDPDKQLAVMVAFSSLTNQGNPVVPSMCRVVQHLQPAALRRYVDWLKTTFLQPQLENLLDFSTRKQKDNQEGRDQRRNTISRLRKWIVARLASIAENHQIKKKEEGLVVGVARFVFFHAFFKVKKATAAVPETEGELSVPLDHNTRVNLVNAFFGLLQSMHLTPVICNSAELAIVNQRRALGLMADGTMWIYHLVQYAQVLLNQPKCVQSTQPFSVEQRQAWDSMIESVASLMNRGPTAETSAFQQLFLLVGMQLFKAPKELVDVIKDLQNCLEKAQEKKVKKKKKKRQDREAEEEPHWVEVMVDILLSLLSQPSRHIRQVCRTVFSSICPHVTATALTTILDVLDPDQDESAVEITDDNDADKTPKKGMKKPGGARDEEVEESEGTDDDSDDDDDEEEAEEEVDQSFRLEMMKVLQQQNALATEENSSDEDLDDEAMMKLDNSLSVLFSEQKKKTQAKRREKSQLLKEKLLVRDFKLKVLDFVEVFVVRQSGSALVLGLVEPLLKVIDRGMSSDSDQQEQDFLRRAADIFRNQLCRSKVYCRTAGDRQRELHDLLEKLMTKAQRLSDSSVCLYYFSASLYLVKLLRGALPAESKEEQAPDTPAPADLWFMGHVDVDRVSAIFKEALCSFMSRRKSPLTGQMFVDLFTRFPVLCVNLVDTAVQNITAGIREHQQNQACVLVLRALQCREVQQLLSGTKWAELCLKVVGQLVASLKQLGQSDGKVVREKVVKALELCHFLVKSIHQQKSSVDLAPLREVLQSLTDVIPFRKTGQLEDIYWAVMKLLGVSKPKAEKTKKSNGEGGQSPIPKKKKKGPLPDSKMRKNRKKPSPSEPAAGISTATDKPVEGGQAKRKRKKNKTKRKQPGGGETLSQPSPPKRTRTHSESKPAKKKPKKEGGGRE